ncbi:DedA family protein [Rhodoplanes sp. TEM]|uniref:DedA family protein n=1 Tax=Rhodoplanes tepidamans TaxID=200616 RepID=A0ABT5J6M1_RHOTP|nr:MULTISPECIES: DedA family protein [Rhodoplanes]MDC7785307.1 DedA family protein [Rhodoplanes tepidamans]MDC7987272.1 DedA family protein [Rhodoplanes sp. TEM]MDQ0353565.1 membrane protein DedA with SNARE-associated domain [Rhodoplanes tepidamans]
MFGWISGFVERSGYLGIALLMLVETVFPPIPSELIMPLAGFAAARGELALVPVILAGSAGSLAGASLWYGLGRWLGGERLRRLAARHGRWLTLEPRDLDGAQAFFRRSCGAAVLLGRLVPGVRTVVSVPAGIVAMPPWRFLVCSAIGTGLWSAGLAAGGFLLGAEFERIAGWLGPIGNVVIGAAAAWYVYRVITFRPRRDPCH